MYSFIQHLFSRLPHKITHLCNFIYHDTLFICMSKYLWRKIHNLANVCKFFAKLVL